MPPEPEPQRGVEYTTRNGNRAMVKVRKTPKEPAPPPPPPSAVQRFNGIANSLFTIAKIEIDFSEVLEIVDRQPPGADFIAYFDNVGVYLTALAARLRKARKAKAL